MADIKGQDKRFAKRMEIDAQIKLKSIGSKPAIFAVNENEIEVEVINISKGGMAFKTPETLPLNSFYDVKVVLWTKETFDSVIEIIRMENNDGEEMITYGCKFIGITAADQFKMDVYELINDNYDI